MNFNSHGIYETRCVFYSLLPKAQGYKNTQLISKILYEMKIYFRSCMYLMEYLV